MHVAVVLGALKQLDRLFIADAPGAALLCHVDGVIAGEHADLILKLAAALSADAHGLAADAVRHGELVAVLFQPVRQMFNAERLALVRDGILDRDHVKAQASAARRYHMAQKLQRQLAHLIEEFRRFGKLLHELLVEHKVLCAAHDEDRKHILLVVILVVPVVFHNADLDHLVQHRLGLIQTPAQLFGQCIGCRRLAHAHLERHACHVVGQDVIQHPVFRTRLVHLDEAEFCVHAVGDHLCDLHDQRSQLCHISTSTFILVTL